MQVLGDEVEATGEEGRGAFQPAPRVTEADHKKETKSLHRALDKRLFLLVKAAGGHMLCSSQLPHPQACASQWETWLHSRLQRATQPHPMCIIMAKICVTKIIIHAGTGPNTGWNFPQVAYSQEATIRQTAESALEQALAPSHVRQVYFVGNSPAGHSEREDATVFFHRAQLIKGEVALKQGGAYSDYIWATRSELPEYVEDSTEQTLFKLILSE